ncbi:MAG: sugar transferase [Ruminococcus sp.]|nr:sugar transferase [Ruminococcus sp.]
MDKHVPYGVYEKYIKRLLDIICALAALIVFCWLYAIIAILVRIKLGSPVLFKQDRPGKNGKIFSLYKFRTMTDEKDENGKLLPDEVRLTKFGKFLRNTSLDELPEAFNILKGDMSIVGPRPLLIEYLPWYTETERHRHDVRPGLSGWAQVHGRNFVDWDTRISYDIDYVNNITFKRDFSVVVKSFVIALKRENVAVNSNSVETNLAEERKLRRELESE